MLQVILDERHCLRRIDAYERHLGKVIEVIKTLAATDLVGPCGDHFLDDLFECVSV
jgi:hypothetical protein